MMPKLFFPFGQPVLPRVPNIAQTRQLYMLGAYPSALHIAWQPPAPLKRIQAIAVDNEPDFFWDGENEEIYIQEWLQSVNFNSLWGQVEKAGKFNGSSGLWVNEQVLVPLRISRANTWLSDCLDTYRCSDNLSKRLDDTYLPFAQKFGLIPPSLLSHPNENEIVTEAIKTHLVRIKTEVTAAKPQIIITLGNASLRVLARVLAVKGKIPNELTPYKDYGQPLKVEVSEGNYAQWIPLAHPASPQIYQEAHANWIKSMIVVDS